MANAEEWAAQLEKKLADLADDFHAAAGKIAEGVGELLALIERNRGEFTILLRCADGTAPEDILVELVLHKAGVPRFFKAPARFLLKYAVGYAVKAAEKIGFKKKPA